jgi:hypothetical protein
MPFVPGAEFDVFISYSWADNKSGWVANLERALLERVHVRLGREPKLWRDERELSGEHHFTREIINNAPDGIRIGNRFKVNKAINLPHDRGLERKFLGFPVHSDPPESVEYLPGEQAFNDKVDQLARGLKSLLEEISNRKNEDLRRQVREPIAAG